MSTHRRIRPEWATDNHPRAGQLLSRQVGRDRAGGAVRVLIGAGRGEHGAGRAIRVIRRDLTADRAFGR